MCGLSFLCSYHKAPQFEQDLLELIRRRGPDSFHIIQRTIGESLEPSRQDLSKGPIHITLAASVLALRGKNLIAQPLIDEKSGSVLLWNGEAWRLLDCPILENDADTVFQALLASCSRNIKSPSDDAQTEALVAETIRDVFQTIDGPYSFVFYEGISHQVFYGRDLLGRRSLLMSDGESGTIHVSSVSAGSATGAWKEVRTGGIFQLSLPSLALQGGFELTEPNKEQTLKSHFVPWSADRCAFLHLNRDLGLPGSFGQVPSPNTVVELEHVLMQALKARLTAVSPHLKEGPKYAVLFSGGVDCTLLALLADAILPPSHSIDLLNVAFENPRVIAAAAMQAKLDHAADTTDFGYASCPDRVTGLSSYSQLKALRPNRHWRFVSISVPYVEVERHRDAVINLMYPHKTEMDLSIALALYFAARGSGEVASADSNNSYTSPARVLLSGLGADELFGGYSRHEKAYKRNKYEGLLDELDLDFGRLASRNLGRDDRVVAHWGREIRYPYLDEVFVQWALRLPIWEKCGFGLHGSTCSEPQTKILEPAKILLRLLAWKLGLKRTACEKKRAIQFGTRTARMNQAKKKGTETI